MLQDKQTNFLAPQNKVISIYKQFFLSCLLFSFNAKKVKRLIKCTFLVARNKTLF